MNALIDENNKSRTYYLYIDIIDIKTFDSNMLKLDKKSDKNLDIYNIGYVTTKKMVLVMILIVILTMQMVILKK